MGKPGNEILIEEELKEYDPDSFQKHGNNINNNDFLLINDDEFDLDDNFAEHSNLQENMNSLLQFDQSKKVPSKRTSVRQSQISQMNKNEGVDLYQKSNSGDNNSKTHSDENSLNSPVKFHVSPSEISNREKSLSQKFDKTGNSSSSPPSQQ